MCPTDQVQIVPVQELGHNVRAEREADASVVLAPALRNRNRKQNQINEHRRTEPIAVSAHAPARPCRDRSTAGRTAVRCPARPSAA